MIGHVPWSGLGVRFHRGSGSGRVPSLHLVLNPHPRHVYKARHFTEVENFYIQGLKGSGRLGSSPYFELAEGSTPLLQGEDVLGPSSPLSPPLATDVRGTTSGLAPTSPSGGVPQRLLPHPGASLRGRPALGVRTGHLSLTTAPGRPLGSRSRTRTRPRGAGSGRPGVRKRGRRDPDYTGRESGETSLPLQKERDAVGPASSGWGRFWTRGNGSRRRKRVGGGVRLARGRRVDSRNGRHRLNEGEDLVGLPESRS